MPAVVVVPEVVAAEFDAVALDTAVIEVAVKGEAVIAGVPAEVQTAMEVVAGVGGAAEPPMPARSPSIDVVPASEITLRRSRSPGRWGRLLGLIVCPP